MKALPLVMCLCLGARAAAQDSTFRWNLPTPASAQNITQAHFPDADAVIILKEQGYTEGPHTKNAFVIYNDVTVTTKAIIVKLFNEKAVEAFGSFAYELPDFRLKEERHVFTVRARVMKPDGSVHVLPDTAIKTITGISSGHGRALTQRVMYKIPDLVPGDIVQYEYSHAEPFSYKRQVLFFYHDRYPVIKSAVFINMTSQEKPIYLHFPPEKFGPADVQHLGRSTVNSWFVTNLAAVPEEPYGRPFADVSYLTSIVGTEGNDLPRGWHDVGKNFYRANFVEGSTPKSFMRTLGLNPSLDNASWVDIDSLYTAIRKYFRLEAFSSLYTDYRGVDQQIDDREGDAADMSFIMLKALERWGISAIPVLIRDRRQGEYERSVPSLVWFSRPGLLVRYNGKDQLYDFDRSIPSRYEVPWFITPSIMFAVQDTGGFHFQFRIPSTWREHISMEEHHITLKPGKRAGDSTVFMLKGSMAQHERGRLYAKTGEELDAALRDYLGNALHDVEHADINDFRDNPVIFISGRGPSRGGSGTIDSFLTFQPRNFLLRDFRDRFTQPTRTYDITLDEPFGIGLSWYVSVPAHYDAANLPEVAELKGPGGAMAEVCYFAQAGAIEVKATIVFSSSTINRADYALWRTFLDNVNSGVEREIAFRMTGK